MKIYRVNAETKEIKGIEDGNVNDFRAEQRQQPGGEMTTRFAFDWLLPDKGVLAIYDTYAGRGKPPEELMTVLKQANAVFFAVSYSHEEGYSELTAAQVKALQAEVDKPLNPVPVE